MQEICFENLQPRITALTNGNQDKPLILALHGWLDNAASFIPLSSFFNDYHLIALDLAGHGHSGHRSPDAHYHQVDYVHDLHALIVSQNWQNIILLGHSMGGIIGSIYASCFPERISRFITIESFGPVTKTADESHSQLREAIESRLAINPEHQRHPTSIEAVTKARAKAGDMSIEAAEMLVQRNLTSENGELHWLTDRRLRTISALRLTPEQGVCILRNLTPPTLAILGDSGFEMMRNAVKERASLVSDLTTRTCIGGHHLHMDNPLDVAREIIYFLEQ